MSRTTIYTIKRGDTLSAIARRYGVTVAAIQSANAALIKDVNKIGVGWEINIPSFAETNFAEVGSAFLDCLEVIENLPSFQHLMKVI